MTASLSDQGFTYANGNTVGFANTIPLTGTYTAGDIVLENKPGSALSGWKRLTSGATHVLGTDWIYFNYTTQGNAPIYGARAWCVFDGTLTGTNAPIAGGNVTSVTRNGLGDYTINFTVPMASLNYAGSYSAEVLLDANQVNDLYPVTKNTTSVRVINSPGGTKVDRTHNQVIIFG